MPIIKFPANFTFSFCWSQHRRPTHFSDVKITNKSIEIMTKMEFLVSRVFCTSDVGDWSISPAGTPGMKGTCEATKILFNFHFFFFLTFTFYCALTYFVFSSHFHFFFCTLTRITSIFCIGIGTILILSTMDFFILIRPESDQTFPCSWLANMGFGDLISVTLVVEDAQNFLMLLKISKCLSTSDCWATN